MSLFDDLFGSSGGDMKSVGPQPWKGVVPYLNTGLQQAQNLLNKQINSPGYKGPLYAGINQLQKNAAGNLSNFAQGTGTQLTNQIAGLANSNAAAGQNFGANANSIFGAASVDPTQQIISQAGQYANNPFADGLVDAATRDVSRQLFENDLPALNNSASATGNLNSSRAGAMEGVLRRGAADRVADISSNIRGGLFNNGLSMAQNQFNQNISNQLNANAAIGQAGAQAADFGSLAQQMGFGNADAMARAGSIFQQDQQGQANAALQRFNMNDTRKNDILNRYWSVVTGTPMGGGSSAMTQGTTGIIPGVAGLGIAAYGAGLFN